jgi:hypothetical protein
MSQNSTIVFYYLFFKSKHKNKPRIPIVEAVKIDSDIVIQPCLAINGINTMHTEDG